MGQFTCAFGVMLVACGCVGVMGAVLARYSRKGMVAWLLRSVGALLFIAALVVGTGVAAYALGLVVGPTINDWTLRGFSEQLFEMPLPDGTTEEGRTTEVGAFLGNGNGCDFVARRVLRIHGDEQGARDHFSRLRLRPAIGDGAGGGVPFMTFEARGDLLVVAIVDGRYDAGLDARCH
jgi:hypothetical protein